MPRLVITPGQFSIFLLGTILTFFDSVYPLEQLGDLERDLGEIYGATVTLPHLQSRGVKVSLKDLGRSQLEWIIEHCRAEYDLLAHLNTPEAVWQRWTGDERQWVKKKNRTS